MTSSFERKPKTVPVAVIVPAYNIEKFIAETLDSLLAQTMRPMEIIVVNDGSTDGTAAIARSKGVIVLDQKNGGLSNARNAGMRLATASWIAYCDGDDLWHPEKLERQWDAIMVDERSQVAFTDFWQFNKDGILNQSVVHEIHPQFERVQKEEIAPGVWRCNSRDLCDLLPRHCAIVPSTLFMKRDLLVEVGGCDETLKYTEDIELELRLFARTTPLFVDTPLLGYRRHADSMTANRLKMRSGDIDVAERVFRAPTKYLPTTLEWFKREWPTTLSKAGRMAVVYGDHQHARKWLGESWGIEKRIQTLLWLLASYATDNFLGKRMTQFLMRQWFEFKVRRSKTS